MADAVENARRKADKPLTDEQRERLEEQARRTELISRGVKRGPNAPKDGIFGGVRKESRS